MGKSVLTENDFSLYSVNGAPVNPLLEAGLDPRPKSTAKTSAVMAPDASPVFGDSTIDSLSAPTTVLVPEMIPSLARIKVTHCRVWVETTPYLVF